MVSHNSESKCYNDLTQIYSLSTFFENTANLPQCPIFGQSGSFTIYVIASKDTDPDYDSEILTDLENIINKNITS